jgi:hypothetical protein
MVTERFPPSRRERVLRHALLRALIGTRESESAGLYRDFDDLIMFSSRRAHGRLAFEPAPHVNYAQKVLAVVGGVGLPSEFSGSGERLAE